MAILLICGFLSGLCLTALALSAFVSVVPDHAAEFLVIQATLGVTGLLFGLACIILTRWHRLAPDAPVFTAAWPSLTLGAFAAATTVALTLSSIS